MFGGFVQWQAGVQKDGSDSIAVQLAPKTHWPEMRVFILVVSTLEITALLQHYLPLFLFSRNLRFQNFEATPFL